MFKKWFKSEVIPMDNEIILKPSLYIGQIFYCLLDGRIEKVVIDRIDIHIHSSYIEIIDGRQTITCNGELPNMFNYNGRIDRLDRNCFLYIANKKPYFTEYSVRARNKDIDLYETVEEVIKLIEKS